MFISIVRVIKSFNRTCCLCFTVQNWGWLLHCHLCLVGHCFFHRNFYFRHHYQNLIFPIAGWLLIGYDVVCTHPITSIRIFFAHSNSCSFFFAFSSAERVGFFLFFLAYWLGAGAEILGGWSKSDVFSKIISLEDCIANELNSWWRGHHFFPIESHGHFSGGPSGTSGGTDKIPTGFDTRDGTLHCSRQHSTYRVGVGRGLHIHCRKMTMSTMRALVAAQQQQSVSILSDMVGIVLGLVSIVAAAD